MFEAFGKGFMLEQFIILLGLNGAMLIRKYTFFIENDWLLKISIVVGA